MRPVILLALLFSMCGAQTRSTQKESQDTGAVAAEISTQLDVSAELKELRDMVVELRVMLRYTQGEVEVLETENAAMKTRLTVTETEVTHLKMENEATVTELKEHREELAALKTRLNEGETEVMNLKKENVELKTRLAATETDVENLETEIKAAPKVAFSAALPSSEFTEAGSNDLNLVFSRIITNVGQAYSSVSGFFRAPVRGLYYFRFTVMEEH
ncbi:uncharacterized protein LOC134444878 [Engraulis encrasicolus]|uniref:uncharacterized protein LOC134444878 n=1 Tax=Engraulis encrasicolus TaxID=184585 RepID=UPI002FCF57DF